MECWSLFLVPWTASRISDFADTHLCLYKKRIHSSLQRPPWPAIRLAPSYDNLNVHSLRMKFSSIFLKRVYKISVSLLAVYFKDVSAKFFK
jgi:hypothetical protein